MNATLTSPAQTISEAIDIFVKLAAEHGVYNFGKYVEEVEIVRQGLCGLLSSHLAGFSYTDHRMSDYDIRCHYIHLIIDGVLHNVSTGETSLEVLLSKDTVWIHPTVADAWFKGLQDAAAPYDEAMRQATLIREAIDQELTDARADRNEAAKPLYYGVGDQVVAKCDFKTKDKVTHKFVTHNRGLIGKVIWIGDDSYNPGTKRTGFQLANGVVIYTAYGNLIKAAGTSGWWILYNAYTVLAEKVVKLIEAQDKAAQDLILAANAYRSRVTDVHYKVRDLVKKHYASA